MCAFFTRIPLRDDQVKQLTGDSLTLSGETNFAGILKSKGIEIDAFFSGATSGVTGHVLTFLPNGKIELAPPSPSTGNTNAFDSNRDTTRVGIPVVNASGSTVQEFLEAYFFPSVDPQAILTIATGGAARQFGDFTLGNLGWTAIVNTNPITLIEADTNGDGIYNTVLFSGSTTGDTGGTVGYTVEVSDYSPPTGTTQTSRTYRLRVTANPSEVVVDTASITWRHQRFWFKSSTLFTGGTTNTALQDLLNGVSGGTLLGSELATTRVKTFPPIAFSSEFFYYVYPVQFGDPSFIVNGLPNNAWGNPTDDPPTLFTFSYTNSNGYTETFNVARSDSLLGATFNIVVS